MKLAMKSVAISLLLALLAACSSAPSLQTKGRTAGHFKAAAQAAVSEQIYIVRSGDTLSSIGRRFGVSSWQLQSRNQIADPRTLAVGQRLYISGASSASSPAFVWPLAHLDVSSEFGTRNNRHKGIDLRAPRGTAIRASSAGVVSFVGWQNGYGRVVILKHGDNVQTLYAHNERNLVKKGQKVRQGEVIATVGRSGNASGYHVHFEFVKGRQPLNPRLYVSM